jgi:hypothetical protein
MHKTYADGGEVGYDAALSNVDSIMWENRQTTTIRMLEKCRPTTVHADPNRDSIQHEARNGERAESTTTAETVSASNPTALETANVRLATQLCRLELECADMCARITNLEKQMTIREKTPSSPHITLSEASCQLSTLLARKFAHVECLRPNEKLPWQVRANEESIEYRAPSLLENLEQAVAKVAEKCDADPSGLHIRYALEDAEPGYLHMDWVVNKSV